MENTSEAKSMKEFADLVGDYIIQKYVNPLLEHCVMAWRAKVVANPGDQTLSVQMPFDLDASGNPIIMSFPCVESLKNIPVNSFVLIEALGGLSNAWVECKADLTNPSWPLPTSEDDGKTLVASEGKWEVGDPSGGVNVIDNLSSTSADDALSANMGRELNDTKQAKISTSGILKGDGSGGVSAAVSGTDYQAPIPAKTYDAYGSASAVQTALNSSKLSKSGDTATGLITFNGGLAATLVNGGLSYVTTAPTSANTNGLKFAVLSSEPTTKYNGWVYLIGE